VQLITFSTLIKKTLDLVEKHQEWHHSRRCTSWYHEGFNDCL